jgi:hypothetical protein
MILHLVVGMEDRLQVVVTECGKTVENLRRPNVETMSDFKTMFLNNDIDIPEETQARVVDILNLRLADAVDLQTKAKHAHWNVKGTEFFALHQLFAIAGRCAQHNMGTVKSGSGSYGCKIWRRHLVQPPSSRQASGMHGELCEGEDR